MAVEKGNPKLLIEYQINMLRQEFSEHEDRCAREMSAMKAEYESLRERHRSLAEEQKRHTRLLAPIADSMAVSRVVRGLAKGLAVLGAGGATAVIVIRWLVGVIGGN